MPASSPEDEKKWSKAKEIAKEKGEGDNYAYIMGIYKKMKPDYFKGKKANAVRVAALFLAQSAGGAQKL